MKMFIILATTIAMGLLCLDASAETVTHNGVTYGTVTSPYTGKIWLDRNLGASKVCTALNDAACYGDYYQWGRDSDGHEKANSGVSFTKAVDIENVGTMFIDNRSLVDDWVIENVDATGRKRMCKWAKADGSSICPIGFRVPSGDELAEEMQHINNEYDSFLKIPSAGNRRISNIYQPLSVIGAGTQVNMWVNSDSTIYPNWGKAMALTCTGYSQSLCYSGGSVVGGWDPREDGKSVRCISNVVPQNLPPSANPGPKQRIAAGNSVTLDASLSTDCDGSIVGYEWTEDTTVLSTNMSFSKSDFSIGYHRINLTVTDNEGASASNYVTLIIDDIPKETISYSGRFTNSIDFTHSLRRYEFTLTEKTKVTIDASSTTAINTAGWVTDDSNTKISGLYNWKSGENGQFKFDEVLEAGTYLFDIFAEDGGSGDFSFDFSTIRYVDIVAEPWNINIPLTIEVSEHEYIITYLDITPKKWAEVSTLSVTSSDLPSGFTLNTQGYFYDYHLRGVITQTQDFSITLTIHDSENNFTKEQKINFVVNKFDIDAIIGDGHGSKVVVKKATDGTIKPFKVAFDVLGFEANEIDSVTCQFRGDPLLSITTFDEKRFVNGRSKFTCDVGLNQFLRGATGTDDFMTKLLAIGEKERFLTIDVNLKDGTSVEKKIMEPIPVEEIGGYITLRLWKSSASDYYDSDGASISILKADDTLQTFEGQDIQGQEFRIDFGDKAHLTSGRWTLGVDKHEMLINLYDSNCGLTFTASSDNIKNETLLAFNYIMAGEQIAINMKRRDSSGDGLGIIDPLLKIGIGAGIIWERATQMDDDKCNNADIYKRDYEVAVRGTTFSMILGDDGIDSRLYEGILDITKDGVLTTLKDMEQYTASTGKKSTITKIEMSAVAKQYLNETSLYQSYFDSTVSRLNITTNIENASYILIGDNVRIGSGKVNSFDNILEGSYTLKFLPVVGYIPPVDMPLVFNGENLVQELQINYMKKPFPWTMFLPAITHKIQ